MPDPTPAAGAADQGTPAYRYDLDEVERCHRLLRAALPVPSTLFYSVKANPHPAVGARLFDLGCHAEVSSSGELAAALAAGADPQRILFTGPGKRDPEVEQAMAAGVLSFSVDSPRGLDQVDRAAAAAGVSARCLLRLNGHEPARGHGLAMTGHASAFGADIEWVEADPAAFASRPSAAVHGLHLYLGSNLLGEDELVAQFEAALVSVRRARAVLAGPLDLIDLGGGFGAPFARPGDVPDLPTLADRIGKLLDDGLPGWRGSVPAVAFESGRFLTSTCGTLLVQVADVKRSHGRQVVVLESGINHLGGMSGLRRLPPINPQFVGVPAGPEVDTMVTGPLCTPLDTWSRSARLPPLRPGDLLTVPNVGAYGLTASLLGFLGHPTPVEVVVDRGRVTGVSQLRWLRDEIELRR